MKRWATSFALCFPAAVMAHHVELLPALEYEPPAPGTYVLAP